MKWLLKISKDSLSKHSSSSRKPIKYIDNEKTRFYNGISDFYLFMQ